MFSSCLCLFYLLSLSAMWDGPLTMVRRVFPSQQRCWGATVPTSVIVFPALMCFSPVFSRLNAFFTQELWKISGKFGPDSFQSLPFPLQHKITTRVTDNWILFHYNNYETPIYRNCFIAIYTVLYFTQIVNWGEQQGHKSKNISSKNGHDI